MLNRFTADAQHIYLAIGATDFRKQISSLVSMVQLQFGMDPFEEISIFLFCNKKKDSIKVLRYDKDETRIQCNKEPGKRASSESFMWVMRSAACEEIQAAYFHYSKTGNRQTAKANHLDVYEYLKYLLTEMPNNNHVLYPEMLDHYLPWSKELPDSCKLSAKHKKCFKK